jgi:tetratricopeptide (TPR) repeat protein
MTYEESTEAVPFTPEMEASLRQIVLNRAPTELAQLAGAVGESEEFAHLPSAATAAFHLGKFAEAKEYADRALAMAPTFHDNWNYGNAIHLGQTVLGLLALNAQDHQAAVVALHESGRTPGSPQLNSFGPTMQLAKALLGAGQVEPVLAYLGQCRVFWKMGATWLDLWDRKIRQGQVPNFFQHCYA